MQNFLLSSGLLGRESKLKRQNVIAKIQFEDGIHPRLGTQQTIPQNLLLEFSNEDMTQTSWYDGDKMLIVESGQNLDPSIRIQDWYWNASTQKFQQIAP